MSDDHSADSSLKKKSKTEALGYSLTIHGLPNILGAKQLTHRLIWLVIFLSSSAAFGYMIHIRTQQYVSRAVMWSEQHVSMYRLTMPMIAICDSRVERLSSSKEVCELQSCEFRDSECNHNVTTIYDRNNGCMYVNTSRLIQELAGPNFSLQLVFAVDTTLLPSDSLATSYKQSSLQLYLFENGHYPLQTSERYLLTPQYHHDIPLKKRIVKRLPFPFISNCRKGSIKPLSLMTSLDTDRNLLHSYRTYIYNDEACLNNLQIHDAKAVCNDTLHGLHFAKRKKSTMECLYRYYHIMWLDNPNYDPCPLPCYKTLYNAAITRLPLPESYTKSKIFHTAKDNILREEPEKRMDGIVRVNGSSDGKVLISMDLFYKDMAVVEQQEREIYPLDALISDVGGLMGLFVGASIYSLIELLLFLFISMPEAYHFAKRQVKKINAVTTS